MLTVITLSVSFAYCYADCHYAKCLYADCHYAKCRGAEIFNLETPKKEFLVFNIYFNT